MAATNATPYVHSIEINGTTTELVFKPFAQVPVGVIRKNRKNPEEGMWVLFEWALSEDDLEALDDLPIAQLEDVFNAWQAADKVTAGES